MTNFDVVGVGLNATDTVLIVPHFPAYAGKAPYEREFVSTGGQVASAMVACARLGLRTRYIGVIGDDERGRIQWESLQGTGVDLEYVELRPGCPNQSAYIIIDRSTGERTILWKHDECLRIDPASIDEERIAGARVLLIDGHDTDAVARAAEIARARGIPVIVDVDTIYHGFERVLPNVDYLVASAEFPKGWTGLADPFDALEALQKEYGMKVAAMTLGAHGALARADGRFYYRSGISEGLDGTGGPLRRVGGAAEGIWNEGGGHDTGGARRTGAGGWAVLLQIGNFRRAGRDWRTPSTRWRRCRRNME